MLETSREKSKAAKFLLTPSLLWLALFIIAPIVIVVVVSFATRGAYGKTIYDFTWSNYTRAFDS